MLFKLHLSVVLRAVAHEMTKEVPDGSIMPCGVTKAGSSRVYYMFHGLQGRQKSRKGSWQGGEGWGKFPEMTFRFGR